MFIKKVSRMFVCDYAEMNLTKGLLGVFSKVPIIFNRCHILNDCKQRRLLTFSRVRRFGDDHCCLLSYYLSYFAFAF